MKKYIRASSSLLLLTIISALLGNLAAVALQFIKGNVLNTAITKNLDKLVLSSGLLIVVVLLECVLYYIYNQNRAKFTIKCSTLLREDYFSSLLNRDFADFRKKNTGEYLSKFSNDLELLKNMYFSNLTLLLYLLSKIIFVSVALVLFDWRIAFITIFLLSMPIYVPKLVEKKLVTARGEYVDSLEKNLNKMTDWLSKFETIKMFSIEKKISKLFAETNDNIAIKTMKDKQINNITNLLTMLMSYYSHIIIILVSAYFVYEGSFNAGMFFIAVSMIDQLSYPIISISGSFQNFISVRKIAKDVENEINQYTKKELSDCILELKNEIKLDNINFKYEGEHLLLSNLNFTFEKNKKYLIRGESGSGKTTIIDLMLNYMECESGEVLYDGIFAREIEPYQYVTVIRQDAEIFNDTLQNNLTLFSNRFTDEELIDVLEKVNLQKFANKESLAMNLGENGSSLSGGERKRICFARALLRDTNVLIFDEPLANLDKNNIELIEDVLLNLEGRTMITISHAFTDSKLKKFNGILEL